MYLEFKMETCESLSRYISAPAAFCEKKNVYFLIRVVLDVDSILCWDTKA